MTFVGQFVGSDIKFDWTELSGLKKAISELINTANKISGKALNENIFCQNISEGNISAETSSNSIQLKPQFTELDACYGRREEVDKLSKDMDSIYYKNSTIKEFDKTIQ